MKLDITKIDDKIKEFSDLLDTIEASEDKKKLLWKEIYENAITDRVNAHLLFTDLYANMQGSTADHVQVGGTMAKYIERMAKSNDQLLKLAELISKEEEKSSRIDPDDLFNEISR